MHGTSRVLWGRPEYINVGVVVGLATAAVVQTQRWRRVLEKYTHEKQLLGYQLYCFQYVAAGFLLCFYRYQLYTVSSCLKKNQNAPIRPSEHPPVRGEKCQNIWVGSKAASNRVAKKMRTYFEMGTDGHHFYVFNWELVDFEGTFGGYLSNCLFVRYVQMVASAC